MQLCLVTLVVGRSERQLVEMEGKVCREIEGILKKVMVCRVGVNLEGGIGRWGIVVSLAIWGKGWGSLNLTRLRYLAVKCRGFRMQLKGSWELKESKDDLLNIWCTFWSMCVKF